MAFVFQCYTMGLGRCNYRVCIMLAKISNEFLCSISKNLGRNRNLYFLVLTKLEEQVKGSAHYFFTCLCHLYWYCSHGKILAATENLSLA